MDQTVQVLHPDDRILLRIELRQPHDLHVVRHRSLDLVDELGIERQEETLSDRFVFRYLDRRPDHFGAEIGQRILERGADEFEAAVDRAAIG